VVGKGLGPSQLHSYFPAKFKITRSPTSHGHTYLPLLLTAQRRLADLAQLSPERNIGRTAGPAPERVVVMIAPPTLWRKQSALARLIPFQELDFHGVLKTMEVDAELAFVSGECNCSAHGRRQFPPIQSCTVFAVHHCSPACRISWLRLPVSEMPPFTSSRLTLAPAEAVTIEVCDDIPYQITCSEESGAAASLRWRRPRTCHIFSFFHKKMEKKALVPRTDSSLNILRNRGNLQIHRSRLGGRQIAAICGIYVCHVSVCSPLWRCVL